MPPSVAREFFDRLVNDPRGVDAIRRLINPSDPLFESAWLDCKGEEQPKPGRVPDPKQQEKSNRRAWSEYLSAFANTGGGVLIWGLDARKMEVDGREMDYVGAEAPVTDPVGLASKLIEWQGQAVSPPLSGVEVRPYALPEDSKKGVVVCFVPEGSLKPYQSLQTADKQYYIRGGTNNFVIERPTLAAMFYPRSKGVFRARANLEFHRPPLGPGPMPAYGIVCRLELFNDGTATAKEVWVRVTWQMPGKNVGIQAIGGVCDINLKDQFGFRSHHPLNPGLGMKVLSGTWEVEPEVLPSALGLRPTVGVGPSHIELTVYAENQEPQVIRIVFHLAELEGPERLVVEATARG